MSAAVSTSCTVACSELIWIAEPVTSMTLEESPSSSLALAVKIWPTCTATVVWKVLKPFASTRTTYIPGANAPEVNAPESPVVKLWVVPVSLLETVTLAPETDAPCGSVTVPDKLPVETDTCAKVTGAVVATSPASRTKTPPRTNRRVILRIERINSSFERTAKLDFVDSNCFGEGPKSH